MTIRSVIFLLTLGLFLFNVGNSEPLKTAEVVGSDSKINPDPRQEHARFVRFRPGDNQMVTVNPPRFSWPAIPEIVFKGKIRKADQWFTLQISKNKNCAAPVVEVKNTLYNFYNFIPKLVGARVWYWRVGYNVGTGKEQWSDIRTFRISEDAIDWDRSNFNDLLDSAIAHPRILINGDNRETLLRKCQSNPYSSNLAKFIISTADQVQELEWYRNFPTTDSSPRKYYLIGRSLLFVAFAYVLTGDEKYVNCKERFLKMAAWPPGGRSAPESKEQANKWETHLTEYLGLFYDWFYHRLMPNERYKIRNSLEWRIDQTMNNFAWRIQNGTMLHKSSIAVTGASHPYENMMAMIPGALSIHDESKIARQALELGIHFIIGISNSMGEDEAWNEGAGYGNGKMKWLTDATWYLQSAIPELQLRKNKAYSAYTDFFARITPVGAKHSSFGNRSHNEIDWLKSRISNFRRVAMLRQDANAMQNWLATTKRLTELGHKDILPHSPWIDFVLPYFASEPKPQIEKEYNRLFPLEGWVTVSSAPPSDYKAQKEAISMTFVSRPRGGYSHSFHSENAFDLHAFGETIAVGGGSTSNHSRFADHTMSHNTILVNGFGQKQAPVCGRIIAYKQGKNFVYWAGDATAAYHKRVGLKKFVRHVLFVDQKYFVIYDDLQLHPGKESANFQWLYHIAPAVNLNFDPTNFRIYYKIGRTQVVLQHLGNIKDLTFNDYRGLEGMVNKITGEDLRRLSKREKRKLKKKIQPKAIDANHIWISNKIPQKEMQFLAVIVPFREGQSKPVITNLDKDSVIVSFRGKQHSISFSNNKKTDIQVDVLEITKHQ